MAGAERGPRDLGWLCAPRREASPAGRRGDSRGEEICIDSDPDRPHDSKFRHCRYEQRLGASVRICDPSSAPIIGDPCTAETACPKDSACQAGLCLPRRLEPGCWLDGDCGANARCALGSCVPDGA